jgi:uncharacterized protein (DUF2267 family)
MEYQQFIEEVKNLHFVEDEEMADAAVKGVLGRLASRLREPEARRFSEQLPEPFGYEKLRSIQAYPTNISAEQYIEDVRQQFRISHENAEVLVKTVLHLTKDTIDENTLKEIEEDLPSDWKSTLLQA